MDVRQIEAFQSVMLLGTTARAAEMMGISQPAVSKAISTLEHSVGFKRFDREKGRLVPSAEGQLFFKEVEISFAGIANLRSAAARIRDYGSGEFRLGGLSAFSTNILPNAIAVFNRKNPTLQVSFTVAASSSIRDMVAASQLDLAIAADEIDTTGVTVAPFANVRAALALPPDHPLCSKDVIEPHDLQDLPFVALAPEDTTRREAETIFAQYGVSPRIVIETAYSSTICAFVLAGLGCGIVDPVTAVGYTERGLQLRRLEPKIEFRTLILFPPQRKSRLTTEMKLALEEERDRFLVSAI
jgi:DNA-binding transcriptional LysR family regulator